MKFCLFSSITIRSVLLAMKMMTAQNLNIRSVKLNSKVLGSAER